MVEKILSNKRVLTQYLCTSLVIAALLLLFPIDFLLDILLQVDSPIFSAHSVRKLEFIHVFSLHAFFYQFGKGLFNRGVILCTGGNVLKPSVFLSPSFHLPVFDEHLIR